MTEEAVTETLDWPATTPMLETPYNKHISAYLNVPLDARARRRRVEYICSMLRRKQFETVAFRGVSGALVAPIVAHELDKDLAVVRKDSIVEPNHTGGMRYEGPRTAGRYIIVDDFQGSGATMAAIIDEMSQHGGTLVGVVEYGRATRSLRDYVAGEFNSQTYVVYAADDEKRREYPGVQVYGGYGTETSGDA